MILSELVAAYEAAARTRLPAGAWDYVMSGAAEGVSAGEAGAAWRRYRLWPHVLRDVSSVDTGATLFHDRLAAPVAVAPTAAHALAHPNGEVATAEGTRRAGSLVVLSSRASRRIEDVAAAAGPWWFQVYVLQDRRVTDDLVRRAADAGAGAIVLTGDTPYVARKRRLREPLALPEEARLVNVGPGPWAAGALDQDPSVTVDEIARLAEVSGLPVLVKGVLRPDDAQACVAAGAAGVVVSNHGGRQLDRAVAAATAVPAVAGALRASGALVLADGGIRSGLDVLVALALGAHAVLVGRPVVHALAAEGADGVANLLEAFADDLAEAMALSGARSTAEITGDLLAGLEA